MRFRFLVVPVVFLAFGGSWSITAAQITPSPGAAAQLPSKAARKSTAIPQANPGDGAALTVVSNVADSVSVDAVLLPPTTARRIFGKEISDHYAVVQMTISNHNQTAALILQSALLDYSDWLFSNNFQGSLFQNNTINTSSYQAANSRNQIASTEARLVRGELEDAQLWTARNAFIRAITAVGTVATGYEFLTTSSSYLSGIGAFSGDVVPALATFWPDRTQLQLNRVSDFGFQTNHVIGKGSSDVVVAFFPLDRFITPNLRKIYLKSPAVFFVPGEMLIDQKYSHILASMLKSAGLIDAKQPDQAANAAVAGALSRYEFQQANQAATSALPSTEVSANGSAPDASSGNAAPLAAGVNGSLTPEDRVLLSVLEKLSLNNIRLVVGGVMTVDVNTVPATLSSVTFTEDATQAATWNSGVTVDGIIAGTFLTNGTPSIVVTPAGATAPTGSIGAITVDSNKSTDKALAFSVVLSQPIASGSTLSFTVTKQAADKSSNTSATLDVPVNYTVPNN